MASPVAHGFIGLALGILRFVPAAGGGLRGLVRSLWAAREPLFICIVLANAPDLDYLFGIPQYNLNYYHQTVTHTWGWVGVLTLAVWWRGFPNRSGRALLFVFVVVGSHLVVDFFTQDTSRPYGCMQGWPFSQRYWISPVYLIPAVNKRLFSDVVTWHNVRVLATEALLTLPLVAGALALKWRGRRAADS